ncbi:hypothetical protein [Hymenobacter arizonensis]|uniref:DUF4199 domain-containing protein n=1 Tax=Hymenobacter arizonensis TaxID=1227077 RepID=A0A1I6BL53_HYMAR|nr:hypothetical protein [Hymenobacter arizonensis]SFQ81668.1 hypothetical protein SAMN04515668_4709 [Hymenobacter arizonensis]
MTKYRPLLEIGLMTALVGLIALYALAYWFSGDGFDLTEIAWLSLLLGPLVLLVASVVDLVMLPKYHRDCQLTNQVPLSKGRQMLVLFASALCALLLLDFLFFYFVDQSLSKAYAETVAGIDNGSNETDKQQVIATFARLPFLLQNSVLISGFLLIATVVAVPIAARVTTRIGYQE